MGLFNKLFGEKTEKPSVDELSDIKVTSDGNSISIGDIGKITFGSDYVGTPTNSRYIDFYVYEWFIKETGEVFYVGKGRGDRYKSFHESAYEAEKIRKLYETDVKFVAEDLTEEQALELETREMTRILNETNDRLTNRFTPFLTKRDNGYSRSPSAPPYEFETAPVLYASEIDEHYFHIQHRSFDIVQNEALSHPAFISKGMSPDENEIVYGGNFGKYYRDVTTILEEKGCKIIKTRYAKSVTSWIYTSDDYVTNYEINEQNAEEQLGRRIPAYHLIDVWKYLIEEHGHPECKEQPSVSINPIHNRVPLSQIKNLHNWEKGFKAGFKYWEEGETERKAGNIEKAILLFDKARFNGYFAPALYASYSKAYRKLKDLDNEIAILDEAIDRYHSEEGDNSNNAIPFEEERKKAIEKMLKKK